jgi:hypothetical protein
MNGYSAIFAFSSPVRDYVGDATLLGVLFGCMAVLLAIILSGMVSARAPWLLRFATLFGFVLIAYAASWFYLELATDPMRPPAHTYRAPRPPAVPLPIGGNSTALGSASRCSGTPS